MSENWQKLAIESQPWEGEIISHESSGIPILLAKIGGELRAYHDCCAHQGVRISKGSVSGDTITCPAHSWKYDLRSGQGVNPKNVSLLRLPVMLINGEVLVDIGPAEKKVPKV